MLKIIKYQSYDEDFIKNKGITYSSLLKTKKNDVTDINFEFGGRQKQSISRDVFVKISRSGNNNGVASSVPAISNEHYQKPASLLSPHGNVEIIIPRTLSKESRITTKSGHITLFNDEAKKHDEIYYISKNCDDFGFQNSAQPKLHTNSTDISKKQKCNGFQDENILYKKQIKMIPSKHDNLTKTNSKLPSNKQDNNNLKFSETLIEQDLKSKTKNSLTKVKILNQVLQSPWRPILPYNFRPVSRRDYEVVKSKLDNIRQLDDCYDNTLEAASVTNLSEMIFSNNDAIGTKMRQHSSYYTCVECDKSFSQLRNFKYHMSVHRGTKEFATTCPVCGKYFNDRGYLSSHMKIHRSQRNRKEYKCTLCPKSFNQRVAYNMHVRIHTGIKPHVCDDCGKAFSRKMLLKQHQRTHSGERPYACSYCDKRFADRSNMTLHLRLHTGVKPFICNLCPKTFTKKHHLKSHLNFHTGDKPYSCPRCKLAFTQSSNMRTHYKKCNAQPTDEEK